MPELASELALLPVDVIVATFTPCALAAKHATTTIPIVMAAVADPVGSASCRVWRDRRKHHRFLQHGGETAGKSVELLRDMLPSLKRVAVLANPLDPFTTPLLQQVRLAGQTTGIEIAPVAMARGPAEVEAAFAKMTEERAEAVVVQGIFFSKAVAELAFNIVCRAPRCCGNPRKRAA